MPGVALNDCPYCRNLAVYRSKPTRLLDHVCALLLLQLVRRHGCFRQHYRLIFWPTPEFPVPSAKKPLQNRTDNDQRECSA